MNKKGFTLVEILAVIVILSLVVTITATKGFGAFGNAKNKITKENERTIKESVNVLLEELNNCDDDLKDYEDLSQYFYSGADAINSCADLKSKIKGTDASIELKELVDNNVINGADIENKDITITIKFDDSAAGTITDIYNAETGYNFKSNNQGKDRTKAITTLKFTTKKAGTLSFNWKVSSEKSWDKLMVTINGTTKITKSGIDSGTYKMNLYKNTPYEIEFQYYKDVSYSKYDDTATITNLIIDAKLSKSVTRTDGTYKFIDIN